MKFLKQLPLLLMGCCFTMPAFSQTTTHAKKTPAAGSTLSPEKSTMLCKAWKLDSLSQYGVDNKASGKEVNDGMTFTADGNYFITLDGVAYTGTWTYVSGHINAITKNPDNTFSFKVVTLADGRLVLDYQYPAPDLTRARFSYSPKK